MRHTFERVAGTGELREFLALTDRLYRGDPRFVPPLRQQVRDWWREGVRLYVLRDNAGKVVARTSLHTDADLDAKLGRPLQLFGLTEFAEDEGVAAELLAAIETAGRRAGREAVFGPVSLLPNQSGGVITSGFAERGFADSAWNPPFYPQAYERFGYERRFEADTWICRDLRGDAAVLFPFDDARLAAEGLALHRGNRRKLGEQLPILRGMLNASFAQLGYYTQISAEQLRRQTNGLAFLLDESLLLYLTRDDEPVAFTLCLPDISPFITAVGGDLGVVNQLRLLATRRRYRREAILIIKGTVPGVQGAGYMRLLARELLRNLQAGGYTTLRSTNVGRDNAASAAQFKRMGGTPLHGYTYYEKALTTGAGPL